MFAGAELVQNFDGRVMILIQFRSLGTLLDDISALSATVAGRNMNSYLRAHEAPSEVMSDRIEQPKEHPRSSRDRYRRFVQDYKHQRLDDSEEADENQKQRGHSAKGGEDRPAPESKRERRGKRRKYVREYLRWLRPHRYAVGALFVLALLVAGLEMIEPLFMRFIIDKVLLNAGLDTASRLNRLHLAGALFVGVIVLSRLIEVLKDYRQRLVNVRVMLSLRQSLFDRLLHLPLPKL